VVVGVKVNVARSQEEARLQAERGGMVTAADLVEEDEAEDEAPAAEGDAAAA
jgi:large subunit ribosomal protein L9